MVVVAFRRGQEERRCRCRGGEEWPRSEIQEIASRTGQTRRKKPVERAVAKPRLFFSYLASKKVVRGPVDGGDKKKEARGMRAQDG